MEFDKQLIDSAATFTNHNNKEIYKDLFQPSVKEIGKNLHTLSKVVTVALSPISALVWGVDKIGEYLKEELPKKLESVPEDDIITPDPSVAGPTLEAMRFLNEKEKIRDLFTNLLASSMNKQISDKVHPAFVEIIKQLSVDDATLFHEMFINSKIQLPKIKVRLEESANNSSGVTIYDSVLPSKFYSEQLNLLNCIACLDNLERLKLIQINDVQIDYTDTSKLLGRHENYNEIIEFIDTDRTPYKSVYPHLKYTNLVKGNISLTAFGQLFYQLVIK